MSCSSTSSARNSYRRAYLRGSPDATLPPVRTKYQRRSSFRTCEIVSGGSRPAFRRISGSTVSTPFPALTIPLSGKDRADTIVPTASITGHLHVAELILYGNSLPELSWCPISALSSREQPAVPPPGSTAGPDPEHLERLWACVRAVRAYMTNRFANERGDYPRFICMSSFDLTFVFLTMLKLVSLQVPGWDLARAKEELRFDGRHHPPVVDGKG